MDMEFIKELLPKALPILLAVGILAAVAIIAAILLTVASSLFSVKENENFAPVRDCLPGANCGACGYSGCDAYAKALAEGNTQNVTLCVPGGSEAAKSIAEILGLEAGTVIPRVAYVRCNGKCDAVERKYRYEGHLSCRTADMAYSGDKACAFACLGYGDCAAACPKDAISIVDGVAKVDPQKCIGCGICVRSCPNNIISLYNEGARTTVACSNKDKGALTRKYCTNGCIGCGKCSRVCPAQAITVMENLAVINYNKCISCGKCAEACPVHCIHEVNFKCGKEN